MPSRASTGRPACVRPGRRSRRRAQRGSAGHAVGLAPTARRCRRSAPQPLVRERPSARLASPPGCSSRPWSRRARRTAGRQDAVLSPPRSAGTSSPPIGLPGKESRCLLQNLALLPQPSVLPRSRRSSSRSSLVRPSACPRRSPPASPTAATTPARPPALQRPLERPTAHPIQPDRLQPELRREALPLCHIDSLPDAYASIVRVSTRPGQLHPQLLRRVVVTCA